ncbi:MAG: DUF308 domain-containing protein [Spirochaetaceae bacterium]|nr:DUF308 domain-containing protein [Spirochaetaceae bacterium]
MVGVLDIITGILLVLVGIVAFCTPYAAAVGFEWLATIGFFVFGLFEIGIFISMKPRNAWELANGVINVVLGVLLLASDAYTRSEAFAFVFAIILLFNGIQGLSLTASPFGSALLLFSSILAVIVSLFMLFVPVMFTTLAIGYIFGIYIIVAGIGTIAWGDIRRSAR